MYTAIKYPGKYQADRSELLARVLENVVNKGCSTVRGRQIAKLNRV